MKRPLVAAAAVLVALVLQVSVLSHVAIDGVVPDLVLLVVVATALVRGERFALVTAFAAGLALDLAPPADHLAGRWALALVLVAYVAGRFRPTVPSAGAVLGVVAGCSFLGTSVFALSGMVLGEGARVGEVLPTVFGSVVLDTLVALITLPVALRLLRPTDLRLRRLPA